MSASQDYVALDWIKGEIGQTLKQAQQALEMNAESPEDQSSLRACLTAIHPVQGQIDLMTSLAGFTYEELEADAATFRVAGVEVRVGRLEKLLRSKERSGRPKDLEFLRAFEARAIEENE